jgi:hypothetical protein
MWKYYCEYKDTTLHYSAYYNKLYYVTEINFYYQPACSVFRIATKHIQKKWQWLYLYEQQN